MPTKTEIKKKRLAKAEADEILRLKFRRRKENSSSGTSYYVSPSFIKSDEDMEATAHFKFPLSSGELQVRVNRPFGNSTTYIVTYHIHYD